MPPARALVIQDEKVKVAGPVWRISMRKAPTVFSPDRARKAWPEMPMATCGAGKDGGTTPSALASNHGPAVLAAHCRANVLVPPLEAAWIAITHVAVSRRWAPGQATAGVVKLLLIVCLVASKT